MDSKSNVRWKIPSSEICCFWAVKSVLVKFLSVNVILKFLNSFYFFNWLCWLRYLRLLWCLVSCFHET